MATRLGEKLRDLRKQRGLTLEKLADMAGLSKSYLWELENRESQRPSAEKLTARQMHWELGLVSLEDDLREPEERHLDDAFFRAIKPEPEAKAQLRKILDTFKRTFSYVRKEIWTPQKAAIRLTKFAILSVRFTAQNDFLLTLVSCLWGQQSYSNGLTL